jgi:hypothetical protein
MTVDAILAKSSYKLFFSIGSDRPMEKNKVYGFSSYTPGSPE